MIPCPYCSTPNKPGARYCSGCGRPLGMQTIALGGMAQGRYQVLRLLGQGGMAAVYQVMDTRLGGKILAMKEMSDAALTDPADKAYAIAAFRQEAELLAQLDHPNIPKVTDFFTEGGKHYIVMEFVQGETLEARLARGPRCSEVEVRAWAVQLGEVLAYLHSQNPPVVFRDLKPANIMLTPQGQVKLIDFGIARLFKTGKSGDTQQMGTPGYASPEQYKPGEQTDGRSDIYSLGVVLHEALTGYNPASTPFKLPPVRQLNPAISADFEQIVTRATETNRNARFQSATELLRALPLNQTRAATPAPGYVPPVNPPQPAPPTLPTPQAQQAGPRVPLFAGALAAVVLLIAGGALAVQLISKPSSPSETVVVVTSVVSPTPAPGAPDTPESGRVPAADTVEPGTTAVPAPDEPDPALPADTPVTEPTSPARPVVEAVVIPGGEFVQGSGTYDLETVHAMCEAYQNDDPRVYACDIWRYRRELPEAEALEMAKLVPGPTPTPPSNPRYYDSRIRYVAEFAIDRYEVTNSQYALCVAAGACRPPMTEGDNPRHSHYDSPAYANHPVVYVSYGDAENYCWFMGGRLPYSYEWEKAARGLDGRTWPWGNEPPFGRTNFRTANTLFAREGVDGTSFVGGDTWPVGSAPDDRSPYDVMDMAGNVMEWVIPDLEEGKTELKGGSWNSSDFSTRTASRTIINTDRRDGRYFDIGFRCAYER